MKIAMVVTGGLHPGGRQQVVPSLLALFSGLAEQHELHAFALRHLPEPRSYRLRGFHVHDLGRPSAPLALGRWAQARSLARAMASRGPFDLVHGFWGDPAGALAVRMGRRFGIPSVATFDSGEFEALPQIEYGSLRTRGGRNAIREALAASAVHVCTAFMARKVNAHGVTAVTIPLTSALASTASAAHHSLPGALRIVQVASLSRVKNQRLLIDALSIIAASIDVRLDLVGEDTLGGELQRHAAAAGVADRVTFHGFVAQDQMSAILSNADLYVQSSLHEAAGVSVLEAAAHGLPVVGTRVGYVADWSPDRALAVDSPDAQSLAAAIEALHHDRAAAAAMAARARHWVREHDVASMSAQFDELYRTTVTRGR